MEAGRLHAQQPQKEWPAAILAICYNSNRIEIAQYYGYQYWAASPLLDE